MPIKIKERKTRVHLKPRADKLEPIKKITWIRVERITTVGTNVYWTFYPGPMDQATFDKWLPTELDRQFEGRQSGGRIIAKIGTPPIDVVNKELSKTNREIARLRRLNRAFTEYRHKRTKK